MSASTIDFSVDELVSQVLPLGSPELDANGIVTSNVGINPALAQSWLTLDLNDFLLPRANDLELGAPSRAIDSRKPSSSVSKSPPYLQTKPLDSKAYVDAFAMTGNTSSWADIDKRTTRMWEYAWNSGPRVIWPPDELEDLDNFDPDDAIPTLRLSIVRLNAKEPIDPIFQEICNFYSEFMARIFYDYGLVSDNLVEWMLQRYRISDSAKYGMIAVSMLIRSHYERSIQGNTLRKRAKEMYAIAIHKLSNDLDNTQLSPLAKLAGLTDILYYEYNAGHLSSYYVHVAQAVPLVRAIVGSDTIDLLSLCGEQAFDLLCFVWGDILDSMATCRPTWFNYVSDLRHAAQHSNGQINGIEWLSGCPNVLAVLLARTTALRHAQLSDQARKAQGSELEQMIRNWHFRPIGAKISFFRVARIGAQEVWRHTAILYVHHAILKSNSDHPLVRNSVKTIIKLAATLKPGNTPDCFLAAPYFIAGSFAVSHEDRHTLRSRLINCGNGVYLRNLASALDQLWEETDAAGRLISWSESESPRIVL